MHLTPDSLFSVLRICLCSPMTTTKPHKATLSNNHLSPTNTFWWSQGRPVVIHKFYCTYIIKHVEVTFSALSTLPRNLASILNILHTFSTFIILTHTSLIFSTFSTLYHTFSEFVTLFKTVVHLPRRRQVLPPSVQIFHFKPMNRLFCENFTL